MRLVIKDQVRPWAVTITLALHRSAVDRATCHVVVRGPNEVLRTSTVLHGCYLKRFCGELRSLHERLTGTAMLSGWDEDCVIELGCTDAAKGIITVQGEVRTHPWAVEAGFEEAHGLEARFGPIVTDQSFLPGIWREIEAFLEGEGILVDDPMV